MGEVLGETREAMLGRVRAALGGRVSSPPQAPDVDDALVRQVARGGDLAERFAATAAATGMKVYRVRAADVAASVIGILRQAGATRIGVSEASAVGPLRDAGFDVTDWATQNITEQFDLDAGVTGVEAAIAETGSLVCTSGDGRSRGLSLIPPIHVAIVQPHDLIADLLDLWPRLTGEDGELPAGTAIITGPSKTADIEGILVTGVHGPGQVHIVLTGG